MKHEYMTVEGIYFSWLYDTVVNDNPETKRYRRLLYRLHSHEFVWSVPNDDNRVADGMDLRTEFAKQFRIDEERLKSLDGPCSVLEMMVALAIRCANDIYDDESNLNIFWEMLDNMELLGQRFQDGYFGPKEMLEVDEKVDILVKRLYKRDGTKGGIFPVFGTKKDQRKTEIWYQLQNYILERKT